MSDKTHGATLSGAFLCGVWLAIFVTTPDLQNLSGWHTEFLLTPKTSIMTVFTTHFFHVDLMHVSANIALCCLMVLALRGIVKGHQLLAIWCVSGPLASLASYLIEPGALVGASGGLMGILGAGIAITPMAEQSSHVRLLVGLLVLSCTVALPGDAVAHVSGLLIGYAITRTGVSAKWLLWTAGACTTFSILYLMYAQSYTSV